MTDIFIPAAEKKEEAKVVREHHVEHHKIQAFSFFSFHPDGIEFETQEDGEIILLFLRKHFITNFSWIFSTLILLALPLFFEGIVTATHFSVPLPFRFMIIGVFFYYLLVFGYAFLNYITWFYNISLVTNKRLIDINYSDLVYRQISATKLELIQDVSYTQVGAIRSIFDYGNLMVQTAAHVDNFEFEQAAHPEDVIEIIETLIGNKSV